MVRGRFSLCLGATLVFGACSPTGSPYSVTDRTLGLDIRTAHGSDAEVETSRQLLALLRRHDVTPWLFTRSLVIAEDAVPHSRSVLTLSARYLRDDGLLLSSFIHEQLHWFLATKERSVSSAVMELEGLFPEVPVGYPEGADSRHSTYLYLLVGWLEWEALTRLVGAEEADRVITFWTRDHYRWVYRTVQSHRAPIAGIVIKYDLQL